VTQDPVAGRVLVVAPSEPGSGSGDGSFAGDGGASGADASGAESVDGEDGADGSNRTSRGTDERPGGASESEKSRDRGTDPDTVAAGIADRLPVEVVLRDERTAGEYLDELGPTIDCVVVLGSDTGPLGCLPDDVSIPAVVCERPVVETGGAEGATTVPVAAVAERVRAVVRETRSRSDLRDQNTRLTALSRYARDITGCETVDAVLDRSVAAVTDALAFDYCVILLSDGDRLVPRASALPDPELRHIGVTEGIAGRTLSSGEAEIVADMQSDPDAVVDHDDLHALLSVPIGSRGVLQIASHTRDAFDERDKEFAEILAGYTREALARLEREVSLRAERDRLHAFYRAVPAPAICIQRREGETTVVEVNDAYEEVFSGVQAGQSLSAAVPTEAERDQYEAALDGEGTSRGSVRRRVGSGEETLALTVIPVTPPGGSHYVFGVYRTAQIDGDADGSG